MSPKFSGSDPPQYDMVGIVFHGFIPNVLTYPITAATLPFLLQRDDPLYHILRPATFIPSNLRLLLRVCFLFFGAMHCATILLLGTIFCLTIGEAFRTCQNVLLFGTKNPKIMFGRNLFFPFSMDLHKYRQLSIIAKVTNEFIYYTLPVSFLVEILGGVVCGYILIKMTGLIPITLTVLVANCAILMIVIILWVVRQFGDVFYQSGDVIRAWNLSVGESKYRSRQVKSCQRLRIELGPFCFIKNETRLEMISQMTYYTISLVMSV